MLHLFTFDPAWVKAKRGAGDGPVRLFYDGHCGLCHRWVRLVLAEDTARAIRFAPLEGDAFTAAVPAAERETLPDSVVVVTADGQVLTRSTAILHLLTSLGGLWRVIGAASRLVPRALRDFAYERVAAIRYRLFGLPQDACPLLPPDLRERFDP